MNENIQAIRKLIELVLETGRTTRYAKEASAALDAIVKQIAAKDAEIDRLRALLHRWVTACRTKRDADGIAFYGFGVELTATLEALSAPADAVCEWTRTSDRGDTTYRTACGKEYDVTAVLQPKCGCGKRVEVKGAEGGK